jgi:hypothetical protein
MNEEFTILKAEPPNQRGICGGKCELRRQIEALAVGEVLRWRPMGDVSPNAAANMAFLVRQASGYKLTVRKVDGGNDIYRTA